jgi:hypothetical protein
MNFKPKLDTKTYQANKNITPIVPIRKPKHTKKVSNKPRKNNSLKKVRKGKKKRKFLKIKEKHRKKAKIEAKKIYKKNSKRKVKLKKPKREQKRIVKIKRKKSAQTKENKKKMAEELNRKRRREQLLRIKRAREIKQRERAKNLFSSIRDKTDNVERRAKSRDREILNRIKNRVNQSNRGDSSVKNIYISKVERQLKNWNAQSKFKGHSATITLTIYSNGHFRYRLKNSTNLDLTKGLKRFLKQLNRVGLGEHTNSSPYTIEVTFRAK